MPFMIVHTVGTPDRRVLEVQRQLVNYRGTLTGKKLLKRGVLKKCNRKGMLQDCTMFLVGLLYLMDSTLAQQKKGKKTTTDKHSPMP